MGGALAISVENIRDPALPSPDKVVVQQTALEASLYRKEVIRGFGQDIDERKKYAHRSFCMISSWLSGVFILILLQGFEGTPRSWFHLDTSLLITIVGTTTGSILGIFIVVMHYLFPAKGVDKE